jgi:hypothetical protein
MDYLLALFLCCPLAAGQDSPPAVDSATTFDPAAVAKWPLERLELKNGLVYEGAVLPRQAGAKADQVAFATLRRPRGRPMYLILDHRFSVQAIAKIERLPDDQRALLLQRIEQFKNRPVADVEKFEMAKIALKSGDPGGPSWIYDTGPWFRLESWTDEEMTRRTVVRIEQAFSAYSEIMPARTSPQRPLRIVLFGSMKEYGEFQKQLGIQLANPAVYLPKLNVVAAGSELSAFAGGLADVRKRHVAIREQYERMSAAMPKELKKLADDLEKNGVNTDKRRATVLAAARKWKQEIADVLAKMDAIDRGNSAQYNLVTGEMLARLCHEAWHAYLENFVYSQAQFEVPRWLNEGLAQIFDEGQLELGTLRLDAPSAKRLAALQADLRVQPRLSLAELLAADARSFLVTHSSDGGVSERHYLYSWGLAYYLAVHEPALESERLNRYVERRQPVMHPVARFEALVGMPLDQFERKWREAMLAMKGPEK